MTTMPELRCSFCGATAVVGNAGQNAGGWYLAVVVPALPPSVLGDAPPSIQHKWVRRWVLCPQCSYAADIQTGSTTCRRVLDLYGEDD
jgi:hypothetical protein